MPEEQMQSLPLKERIRSYISMGESHFREFKSAFQYGPNGKRPREAKEICKDIAETLVAFANADGGDLIVGVEDDHTITGIPALAHMASMLKGAPTTHVHRDTPLPHVSVSELELLEGIHVICYRVQKSDSSICLTSEGRCLKRFDRQNLPTPAEHIHYDRQETKSKQYDREFAQGATVHHLQKAQVDAASSRLAPGFSAEKFLQLFDLADFTAQGLAVKRAALLLFAENIVNWHPRCEVRLVRVEGTTLGSGAKYDVIQDESIRGNVLEILPAAWDALRVHLTRTRFSTSGIFHESIIYPEEACREALINAVAHRDYANEGRPVEILIFDDRVEIKNPGNLLSSVSLEDLKNLKRSHQSRNVLMSHALRELGYMREMGEGMLRIFSAMKDHDLIEPELQSGDGTFTVILHHKSVFSTKDVEWLTAYTEFGLTKNEQRVVLMGRHGDLLSTNQVVKAMAIVDMDDFRQLFESLFYKGVIYSAVKIAAGTKRKRNIPRFKIRPPSEAQQYYDDLLTCLVKIGPRIAVDKEMAERLRLELSEGSPYFVQSGLSMRYLGLVGEDGQFLPKAQSLWKRARSSVGSAPNVARSSEGLQRTAKSGEDRRDRRLGSVVKVSGKYALVRGDDGVKYVAFWSQFRDGKTDRVGNGARVDFVAREGKAGPWERACEVVVLD